MADLLDRVITAVRTNKEELVFNNGVGSDVGPVLYLLDETGQIRVAVVFGGDQEETARGIEAAVRSSESRVAVYVQETICQLDIATDELHETIVGLTDAAEQVSLMDRFIAGDPEVFEAVTVIVAHPEDFVGIVFLPYRYNGRSIVWLHEHETVTVDPTVVDDDGEEDSVVAAIRAGFAGRSH